MVKQVSAAVPSVGALSGITDQAVRQALRPIIDAHNARNGMTNQGFVTRAELDRAIAAMVPQGSSQSVLTQPEDASGNPLTTKPKSYTKADLKRDLANGVESIVASAGPDYQLWVDSAGAKIEIGHKGVVYAGYSAQADTTNTRLPALAITAGGIAMGYNDIDGNWVDAVAIEASTGNASFSGTINALYGNFAEGITIGSTGKTLGDLASSVGYSTADLEADLLAGVGSVLAGTGGNYRMWIDAAGGKLEFGHKDLDVAGLGSAYSGDLRSGMVISSTGIAAGYNRKDTGAWVNALAISSTGDVTIAGTLKASSIIEAGATVSGYGTIGTVANNADQAAIDAAAAVAAAAAKLNKSSADTLSGAISVTSSGGIKVGTIAWDAAGNVTSGSGIAITAKGLVGASGGSATFSISTTGEAYYSGAVSAGQITTGTITAASLDTVGYGAFFGQIPSAITIAGQSQRPTLYGASPVGDIGVAGTSSSGYGVFGSATTGTGVRGASGSWYGVWGSTDTGQGVRGAANASGGIGVHGRNSAGGIGVEGFAAGGTGIGVRAQCALGTALHVAGTMTITSSTLVTNLNADMLDGNHASAFATSGHTHSGYVSVASGRSSGDYVYAVDYSAPSNPSTRAGWVRLATNSGGGGVWVPYYT